MDKLQLEVLTPVRILLETEADHVVLPGSMGEMGILPQHIPVVTMLNGGVLSYFVGQKQSYLAVQGGYAQVDNNRVTVLVERAAFAEEIDVVVAEQDEKDAAEHLKQLLSRPSSRASEEDEEVERKRAAAYEAQLLWAIARQSASQHK